MKYTEDCPLYPDWLNANDRQLPRADLDNDAVDSILMHMLETGALGIDLPTTQYGRRCAVDAMLRYNAIPHLLQESKPWTPYSPVQPR